MNKQTNRSNQISQHLKSLVPKFTSSVFLWFMMDSQRVFFNSIFALSQWRLVKKYITTTNNNVNTSYSYNIFFKMVTSQENKLILKENLTRIYIIRGIQNSSNVTEDCLEVARNPYLWFFGGGSGSRITWSLIFYIQILILLAVICEIWLYICLLLVWIQFLFWRYWRPTFWNIWIFCASLFNLYFYFTW